MKRQCIKSEGHDTVDPIHSAQVKVRDEGTGQLKTTMLYWQGRDVWTVPVVEHQLPFGPLGE